MLTVPEVQSTQFLPHSSPPTIETTTAAAAVPPTAGRKCDAQTCPWWPYSNSKDFKTNAGLIVVILFCVVITVLSLNAAARYLIRRRRRHHNHTNQTTGLEHKPDLCSGENTVEEPPAVLFAAGMKLAGAEAECAICLSEFVEGEEIRVLEKCKHGFHVQCIRKWLNSRKSCPTCRSICYPPAGTSSGEVTGCISGSGAHGDLESGGGEGAPQAPLV